MSQVKTLFRKRFAGTKTKSPRPILRLREILVPLDLSSCSLAALQFAANSAADLGARLTVLHIIETHITGSIALDLARLFQPTDSAAARELSDLARKGIPPDVRSRQLLLHGAPAHEIIRSAGEKKIDLIILPTHCRTGWEHARLGSVAEQVVQKAPCPVLVLPFPETK